MIGLPAYWQCSYFFNLFESRMNLGLLYNFGVEKIVFFGSVKGRREAGLSKRRRDYSRSVERFKRARASNIKTKNTFF